MDKVKTAFILNPLVKCHIIIKAYKISMGNNT